MKIINKDILTVEAGMICQQVNCQGKMNSGLAKSIREKWPLVYEDYIQRCNETKPSFRLLGTACNTRINTDLRVINIFGQLTYGYDNKRYTDYGALNTCFHEYTWLGQYGVYFPYNFGCDRGGGDWRIVSDMIDYYFPDATICKLS